MANNLQFYRANHLGQSYAVLKNGTGGGAPALEQNADFPMTNLLVNDRYTFWKSAGSAAFDVDFDLGASKTVQTMGITALDPVDGGATLDVSSAGGSTYPPSWTSRGTITPLINVDELAAISSFSARYLRYSFTSLAGAIRAKLWAPTSLNDFLVQGSPGANEERRKTRLRVDMMTGAVSITKLGPDVRTFTFQFTNASAAMQVVMNSLAGADAPAILRTPDSRYFEVVLANDAADWTTVFDPGGAAIYNFAPTFRQLP